MDACFEVKLRRPADAGEDMDWAFVVLPKLESAKFARRGRTSVQGTINGHSFLATLEPDGQLSHWFKLGTPLLKEAGVAAGSTVRVVLGPCPEELEPQLPPEFHALLIASPEASTTWDATTTIARIDWIHWIESAKQAKTRLSRTLDAVDMLASGKKRVCCFDVSGYYSQSMNAPREAQ